MDDLTEFITARLDEDEARARAVEDNSAPWTGQWAGDEANFALRTRNGWSLARAVTVEDGFPPGVLAHIVANDPARVLREVAVKRAILALHEHQKADVKDKGSPDFGCGICHEDREYGIIGDGWCATVRHLAAVYSDHPGYWQEWAPDHG